MGWFNAKRKGTAVKVSARTSGAVAGLVVGGPPGAVVGAASGVLLEPLMKRMWDELVPDSQDAAVGVLEAASEKSGLAPEELVEKLSADERTRLLGGLALAAGSRTRNREKIRALGRALAEGVLAADDARLDEQQLLLRALDDMEAPHIRVLELLVRYVPFGGELRLYKPTDDEGAPAQRWTYGDLHKVAPGLSGGITGLLGTLQRHGLAIEDYNIARAFERYSDTTRRESASSTRGRAVGAGGLPPGFSVGPSEWVATDLGRRLLEYLSTDAG